MNQAIPLKDFFKVRGRFCRSVNIVADAEDPDALVGYVVTPLTRAVLRRIGEGLRPGSRARAWSITGPYGTGKSACALFLSKALGHSHNEDARQMLRVADPDLYDEVCEQIPGLSRGGFFMTLLVGSREPIAPAILCSLSSALRSYTPTSPEASDLVDSFDCLYRRSSQGDQVSVREFSEAIERAASLVRALDSRVLGLIVVIDELGKLLEHATLNPARSDVFFLQALAELAARSGDNPIGVLAILHQSFEHYAARLGFLQQQEWSKVQGRFEDIPFMEAPGQLLRLIGEVIQPSPGLDGLAEMVGAEAAQAVEMGLAPPELGRGEAVRLLERCAPLHPTVALVLGRLFRSRLAQNERSLFTFLTSGEPHGLQDYLAREIWTAAGQKSFYRLDELYDYVVAALGSSLYIQTQGKRWAEVADTLERLPTDATALDARLVKAIGMLGLLGDQRRLKASKRILVYALSDNGGVSDADVDQAIERLVSWKICVYRRHNDTYALWQGSDIDLDEQFRKGLASLDRSASLAEMLETHAYLRPYVAKRHLHETGTLRYFVPWVVDATDLDEALSRSIEPADGAIVFVLGNGDVAANVEIEEVVRASRRLDAGRSNRLIFAIPTDTAGLRAALEELRAWEWVRRNTEKLPGDSIALEELNGRVLNAQGRVHELCSRYFERSSSFQTSHWVWAGEQLHFDRPGELSTAISRICDQVYHRAPRIHNELINRRTLSSAAAAARRTLVERMLTESAAPRLGIIGFPPELSMYRSVLETTGLHRQAGDHWEFGPDPEHDPCNIKPLWQAIDEFLSTTEMGKRSISELFDILRRPPYGVKDGLLPIFLAAAILHWDQEVALYETGSFLPRINIAAFERLMKEPEKFAIQRYRLSGVRSYLFEQYAALSPSASAFTSRATLVGAVRPLIDAVKQLPAYTTSTKTLSAESMAVRDVITRAKEPHRLLFVDLPRALGMDPELTSSDRAVAESFAKKLRAVLAELAKAYDLMLERARTELCNALRLPLAAEAARREIAGRAAALRDRVSDLRLKAFVTRLGDRDADDREWLEAVLSCVASKPPRQWTDHDVARFGISLVDIAGQFLRVEEILAESGWVAGLPNGQRLVRVSVTVESGEERRAMVPVASEDEETLDDIVTCLESELSRLAPSKRIRDAAIAELVRRGLSD